MIEQYTKKLISSGRIVGDPFYDSGAQLNLGISASYVWDICAKMTRRPSPRLINNLRSTIARLENDPAVITLKQMLIRRLADLQENSVSEDSPNLTESFK
jgi:hypothetical protein